MQPRRGFGSRRPRTPLGLGTPYGFLRPPRRQEEEMRRFLERVRNEPELRREYRTSLIVQIIVVGVLLAAMLFFVVQSCLFLRSLAPGQFGSLRWGLPALAGLLAAAVARRFLRLLADYRGLRSP